jgi:peptide deformylase
MALQIVHYNDPILRKKGEKITVFDAALARFAKEMIEIMDEAGGIGLAAQQVGQAKQICVVDLRSTEASFEWTLDGRPPPPRELSMPLVLVNPRLNVPAGTPEVEADEGCLSFPQIRGAVKRPAEIEVEFKDEHGIAHKLTADGLLARCIQHEADHLNGILFIDRMSKENRAERDEAIKALARQTKAKRKK